jgi:hypothetical protein
MKEDPDHIPTKIIQNGIGNDRAGPGMAGYRNPVLTTCPISAALVPHLPSVQTQ